MSKPPCGLWPGTVGELSFYGNAEALIAERVSGLDLSEHPVHRSQLSAASRARIKKRIASRTATREEYEHFMWDKRLAKRRKLGIDSFWKEERTRLSNGEKGTRDWSEAQLLDILAGRKPLYNGQTLQAHHTYSVLRYPHLANQPAVVYPATPYEHLKGWHGGSFRKSLPGRRIRRIHEF